MYVGVCVRAANIFLAKFLNNSGEDGGGGGGGEM